MNILLFSGSLRAGSFNRKLVAVNAAILSSLPDCKTTIADIKALSIPVYDGDIEAVGIPDGVKQLGQMIAAADAIVVSSPEYNGAMAGSLKNTIDWISRLKPVPLEKKPVLLTGASPGAFGTIRALGTSRMPFETLGCFLYPAPFALPKANEAFSSSGDLVDGATKQRLTDLLTGFVQFGRSLSPKK